MSDNMATKYADTVSAGIWELTQADAPYGYTSATEPGSVFDSEAEAIAQGIDPDDIAPASASDALSDVLDIIYMVNADRSYRSARVTITVGGPNVYIDTEDNELVVTWGSATVRRGLPAAFITGLDDALGELWEEGN